MHFKLKHRLGYHVTDFEYMSAVKVWSFYPISFMYNFDIGSTDIRMDAFNGVSLYTAIITTTLQQII